VGNCGWILGGVANPEWTKLTGHVKNLRGEKRSGEERRKVSGAFLID
jgi:hypothetical protein